MMLRACGILPQQREVISPSPCFEPENFASPII
ncbi:MAG: hypothetical protein JWM53_1799, partial [bacterium]|nr:hypothetical protein [bacterium]